MRKKFLSLNIFRTKTFSSNKINSGPNKIFVNKNFFKQKEISKKKCFELKNPSTNKIYNKKYFDQKKKLTNTNFYRPKKFQLKYFSPE